MEGEVASKTKLCVNCFEASSPTTNFYWLLFSCCCQDYLLSCAKPRKWEYSVSEVTDQPALSLVEDIIREKICLHTEKEIPYLTTQVGVAWISCHNRE